MTGVAGKGGEDSSLLVSAARKLGIIFRRKVGITIRRRERKIVVAVVADVVVIVKIRLKLFRVCYCSQICFLWGFLFRRVVICQLVPSHVPRNHFSGPIINTNEEEKTKNETIFSDLIHARKAMKQMTVFPILMGWKINLRNCLDERVCASARNCQNVNTVHWSWRNPYYY